jgi:hypothetical protein
MHLQKKLIISDGNPIGKINNLTVLEGLQKPDDTTIFCQPTIKKYCQRWSFCQKLKLIGKIYFFVDLSLMGFACWLLDIIDFRAVLWYTHYLVRGNTSKQSKPLIY